MTDRSTPVDQTTSRPVRTDSEVVGPDAEVVVLGAGISGLVAASVLLDQGAASVLVLDEYPGVGGNHIDVAVGGCTFDVGSFIFQDDSPLLRHFPELLEKYVPIDPSWLRLNPQGVVTAYPFSVRHDLVDAGPVELVRILASALRGRFSRRPMTSAQDFARRWVGARFLRRSGLEHYMGRFCGVPIDQIDLTFAESRMLWMKEQTAVSTVLRRVLGALRSRRYAAPAPTNRQLARPREGFAHLYAPAVARLEQRGAQFVLGTETHSVRPADGAMLLRTSRGDIRASRVVSTIPVGIAARLAGLDVDPLPTVTLVSLFYSFVGDRGFDSSILYNFSHEARWKRLTVYSDFYGVHDGRTFFAVEVVAARTGTSPSEADVEFRAHVAANGLLVGDLRLEGHHVLEEAYPIYTGGSAERAVATVAALEEVGITSFGRQGAFRYQPTARVSTTEAEDALGSPAE